MDNNHNSNFNSSSNNNNNNNSPQHLLLLLEVGILFLKTSRVNGEQFCLLRHNEFSSSQKKVSIICI